MKPTTTNTLLSRKGTRQPHEMNCSGVVSADTNVITPLDRINAAQIPICGQLP